jgi:hypothetical protein
MHNDHQHLITHNIAVYSIKTDAFTIYGDNIELAKSLIKLDNNIGSWRVSTTEHIAFPKVKRMRRIILKLEFLNTNSIS